MQDYGQEGHRRRDEVIFNRGDRQDRSHLRKMHLAHNSLDDWRWEDLETGSQPQPCKLGHGGPEPGHGRREGEEGPADRHTGQTAPASQGCGGSFTHSLGAKP